MSRQMKDSHIDWIGFIPERWQLVPTKRILRGTKTIVGNAVDSYERLALTMNGVVKRNKEDNEGLQPEKFDNYQIIRENELVFKLIDLQNEKTSRVGLSPYTGIVSPAYIILTNRQEDNRYYYYWFIDMYNRLIFNRMSDDGVRANLNVNDLVNIPIPLISIPEQQSIADFLDRKCSEIDSLISLQEKMIEELKAYKQSVITEAVTKGLNPNAPTKDSGIEWIGEIPEEWKIYRIKYNTFLKGRIGWQGLNSNDFIDEGYCLITGTDFDNKGGINWNTCYRISKERFAEDELLHVHSGDLLMTKDGTVGKMAYLENLPEEASLNSHLLIIRQLTPMISNAFLYWAMLSYEFKGFCNIYQSGSIMNSISQGTLGDYCCACPPIEEQNIIVTYLKEKCSEIDSLISLKLSKIERLKEYKKSIIYEYVTGKKEVEA